MDPNKLKEMILRHKEEGRKPFFVNCTAGTTVMGAFDPISDIADICQEHGIWLHVDVRRPLLRNLSKNMCLIQFICISRLLGVEAC